MSNRQKGLRWSVPDQSGALTNYPLSAQEALKYMFGAFPMTLDRRHINQLNALILASGSPEHAWLFNQVLALVQTRNSIVLSIIPATTEDPLQDAIPGLEIVARGPARMNMVNGWTEPVNPHDPEYHLSSEDISYNEWQQEMEEGRHGDGITE